MLEDIKSSEHIFSLGAIEDFPILIVIVLPLTVNKNFPFFKTKRIVLTVSVSPAFSMQQVISVWVRDPRIQKNDFWHAYIDYEICLHVSKMTKQGYFNLI